MINIKTYSKEDIITYINQKNINDTNVESTNEYFISISTSSGHEKFNLFKNSHYNTITLFFDDVAKDIKKIVEIGEVFAKAMTIKQAEKLYNFIDNIKQGSTVHINCSMGQSRSPAVAAFISEHFPQPHNYKNYNKHVYDLLKEVSLKYKKRYIEKYPSIDLGWKYKKWFTVDEKKIREWYDDLEKKFSDWKFIMNEQEHVWKFPISDPEGRIGHRLMPDTAYYTLCWNDDSPGPKPFEQGNAREEYKDNDNDELNPRRCFNGYGLELIKNMPVRSKKWLVTIHTPGTKLITHQDASDKIRVHIPIYTNPNSNWIIGGEEVHMEPGWAYIINTSIPHSVENQGNTNRIHLYGKVWTDEIRALNL